MLTLKRLGLLVVVVTMLLVAQAITSACGGFFCTNTPIDQGAERIIFSVNQSEGTISAVVGINYVGAAADFSWVVPVPSVPTLDVAETISLDTLEQITSPTFSEPANPCYGLQWMELGMGGGGGEDFLEEGNVGPYDYAIIRNENSDELVQWLRDNGYQVTDAMVPIIVQYVEEDMYFLAMKLSQEAEVGDIQPVVMTYESREPMIPIRLTAVAAVPNMPVLTWIFGDTQYKPENFAHPEPDYARFRQSSQITSLALYGNRSPFGIYIGERSRIQQQYNGQAFITEYAQPSIALRDQIGGDPLLVDLIERFPYVTRLRAQMSPEQMTVDPYFVPAPELPDVERNVDLSNWVDPLHYWGCSSRSIRENEAEALLTNYTRIDDLKLHLAYPDGWVVSQFEIPVPEDGYSTYLVREEVTSLPVYVFAPEPVTLATIDQFLNGKPTPPMFVLISEPLCYSSYECGYFFYRELFMRLFGRDRELTIPGVSNLPTGSRAKLYAPTGDNALYYAMLANDAQWAENEATFYAIMDYANSYQFYAHPLLRNTLFLGGDTYNYFAQGGQEPIYVGYPEGWTEHWQDDTALLTPDGEDGSRAAVRLLPISDVVGEGNLNGPPEVRFGDIAQHYGLSESDTSAFIEETQQRCSTLTAPRPFTFNDRQGYFRVIDSYIIEATAPISDFADVDSTLIYITTSATDPIILCG